MKRLLLIVPLLLIAACDEPGALGADESEDLQKRVTQLETQLDDARGKLATVRSAMDNLDSDIRHFSFEDWQDVVPKLTRTASDLSDAITDLDAALTDES